MSTNAVSSDHQIYDSRDAASRPVYIAGPDRSGTTLMFGLLAAHPNISMTRRSNMWRYFYDRYGDLSIDENAERCINDMVRYRKMGHLQPAPQKIRSEFMSGPRNYGRLFAIFHRQHAERSGKQRWGDKSLHNEYFADAIFAEFPAASILHMIRDPRDRYASVSRRHGGRLTRLGGVSGRWNRSVDVGLRNLRRHPDRYMFVRYEDLAAHPRETLELVCHFLGEEFEDQMLELSTTPDIRATESNSSFGDLGEIAISTKAIGRFAEVLEPREIDFVQKVSRRGMTEFGYEPVPVDRSQLSLGYRLVEFPEQWGRMWAWRANARIRLSRGPRLPESKMLEYPVREEKGSP